MRLTVNLEPDLYALARSLAKAEECSISAAVNRLVRRGVAVGGSGRGGRERRRNRLPVSAGRIPVTADDVERIEAEDDRA